MRRLSLGFFKPKKLMCGNCWRDYDKPAKGNLCPFCGSAQLVPILDGGHAVPNQAWISKLNAPGTKNKPTRRK